MVRILNRSNVLVLLIVLAAACGDQGLPSGPGGRTPDLSDAYPYVADSALAGELLACVDPRRAPASCEIGRLPPMTWRSDDTSVAAVLTRLVVSHDWMGARFAEILEREPEEVRRLLGAVTAIVIDDDVRPSFYWTLTGAIYIDPRHLWLTPEEEATISDGQDYRSGFGSDLGFVPFSSYLTDPATPGRTLDGRVRALGALLFHEGAHANDFLPPDRIDALSPDEVFEDAVRGLEDDWLSGRLVAELPLRSELWARLARVLYFGESPDAHQRSLTAEEVGQAFGEDGASDPYAYSAQQEDLAMLFEETMMKFHFDLDRRVGFATPLVAESRDCRDYEIGWGTTRRIAAPTVAPRAAFASDLLVGDSLDAFFAALSAPVLLTPGDDICRGTVVEPASVLRWR